MSLGERHNEGKAKLGLISPYAKEGMARVLMRAAESEYGLWNWEKGLPVDEILESLERHMDAVRQGEMIDEKSALPHVDHMQCNTMFLSHFHHTGRWGELAEGLHSYCIKPKEEEETGLTFFFDECFAEQFDDDDLARLNS